jgi:D-glycero-D-manno-heptose 1,7-bisphosphate phosphatase
MTEDGRPQPRVPYPDPKALRPAVLLDRDGVLNQDSDEFIKSPEELRLLPGSAAAVRRLNQAGYVTAVITNQSGIGRGLFQSAVLDQIHVKLLEEVEAAGGSIARVYSCPHHPDDGCDCRKPKPAMILQALRELDLNPAQSLYIGDKAEDVLCGQAAGVRTILVLSGKTKSFDPARFDTPPDHVAPDLSAAVDWILSLKGGA